MPIAVIDDSGSGGDSSHFVLAGFSAELRTWESFTYHWYNALNTQPKIEYFKMNEAQQLRGQFEGFDRSQSDAKVDTLIDIIVGHDLFENAVVIREDDYRQILQPVQHRSDDSPYFITFLAMVSAFTRMYHHIGVTDPVDFQLDRQDNLRANALRKFATFKRSNPTWQIGRIGFGDDKMLLPLQAADLVAWQTRRFYSSAAGTRRHYRRLHERKAPLRIRLTRRKLLESADAIGDNVPNLRVEFGDEATDRFLAKVGLPNRR
jgi:hypothetical protein